jgi:hypothetical protein
MFDNAALTSGTLSEYLGYPGPLEHMTFCIDELVYGVESVIM